MNCPWGSPAPCPSLQVLGKIIVVLYLLGSGSVPGGAAAPGASSAPRGWELQPRPDPGMKSRRISG